MGIQLNTHEYMWARPCLHACKATNKAATAACNPIEHLACMKLNEIRASISDKNLPLFRHKHKENAGSLRHAGHHEIRPWVAAAARRRVAGGGGRLPGILSTPGFLSEKR